MFFDSQSKSALHSTKQEIAEIRLELSDIRSILCQIRDRLNKSDKQAKVKDKYSQEYHNLYKKCRDYDLIPHSRRGRKMSVDKMKRLLDEHEKVIQDIRPPI